MKFKVALNYSKALQESAKMSISELMGRYGRKEFLESQKSLRNPSQPGQVLKIEEIVPYEARWITIPLTA